MRLKFAVPVLGALALMAALPDTAEARRRGSFDISVGLGYSHHGGHRHYGRSYYDSGISFRYSRGYSRGYDRGGYYHRGGYDYHHAHSPHYYNYHSPRHYARRPVYREYYYPARSYYRADYDYDYVYHSRPLYRRYYYRDYYDYDYCD